MTHGPYKNQTQQETCSPKREEHLYMSLKLKLLMVLQCHMDNCMPLHRALLFESFATHVARERLLSSVDPDVVFQVSPGTEHLPTHCTTVKFWSN